MKQTNFLTQLNHMVTPDSYYSFQCFQCLSQYDSNQTECTRSILCYCTWSR